MLAKKRRAPVEGLDDIEVIKENYLRKSVQNRWRSQGKAIASLVDSFNFRLTLARFSKIYSDEKRFLCCVPFLQKKTFLSKRANLTSVRARLSIKTLQGFQKLPNTRSEIATEKMKYTVFFYKNMSYKNIEAEICDILREYFENKPEAEIFCLKLCK